MNLILKKGLKFLLFGGKGGVGKTTLAAVTALEAARQGKKVLVFSTDPAHSLSDSFDKEIRDKIVNITENLDALELDADALLEDYKKEHGAIIEQIISEGTYLTGEDIGKFSKLSFPGLDEVMALKKIVDFIEENKYDLYILDTAPTGHTMRLLALPDLMDKWVDVLVEMHRKKSYIRRRFTGRTIEDEAEKFLKHTKNDIKKVRDVLQDDVITKFEVITIPEAMGVYETERLIKVLEKYGLSIDQVLINRVIPETECGFCLARKKQQQKYIKDIEKFGYPLVNIPLYLSEVRGLDLLNTLRKIIYEKASYEIPKRLIKPFFVREEKSKLKEVFQKNLKLLLFGGKGGVGKTTLACASALEAAQQGKKVLVFSTDPAHSLSDSFNQKIGNKITRIEKNLDALEMDADQLFEDWKNKYKKEIKSLFSGVVFSGPGARGKITLPFDERIMSSLFDLSPPGIDEIMALDKIMEFMESQEYDLYILDTAPTGHTIRLLALPDIALDWVKVVIQVKRRYQMDGEVGEALQKTLEMIRKAKKTLTDSKKTEFVVITIPEAMGVYQTERLIDNLKALKIPLEHLIVNRLTPANKCGLCLARREMEQRYLKEIYQKFSSYKISALPQFDSEIRGLEDLEKVKEKLF